MSFDKSITSGKERRKPYRGAKAVDTSCRNHGSCPYCRNNRLHAAIRNEEKAQSQYTEYSEG